MIYFYINPKVNERFYRVVIMFAQLPTNLTPSHNVILSDCLRKFCLLTKLLFKLCAFTIILIVKYCICRNNINKIYVFLLHTSIIPKPTKSFSATQQVRNHCFIRIKFNGNVTSKSFLTKSSLRKKTFCNS